MGFMDKAKQLAEQAQQKLDEAQKNFNKSNSPEAQPRATAVKYDEHGRPIQEAPPAGSHRAARQRRPAAPEPGGAAASRGRAAPEAPRRPRAPEPAATRTPARPVQADPVVAERFSRDSMRLGGILTAMVTPFDADGRSTRTPPCGSCTTCWRTAPTGWCSPAAPARRATMTDEEKVRLWELGVAESGDAPIIAGTGTYDTRHSVELTERAHEVGRGRDAGGHALLRAAEPARHPGALRGRGGRHGPPDRGLQHPEPHGHGHAERPARGAGPDRQRRAP